MADFTEKQLEDWLVDNWQQASKRALFPYLPPSYDIELIGRQVFCSVGIIDLLAFTGRTFLVIELKAVTADEKAVEQVIRYRRSIEDAAPQSEFDVSLGAGMGYPSGNATTTVSVVIAPGFTKKALRTLGQMGSISVASFDGWDFSFSAPRIQVSKQPNRLHDTLRPYVASAIGWEIGDRMNRSFQSSQAIRVCEN